MDCICEKKRKTKIRLADGKARSIQHTVATTCWHPDGTPMSAQKFMQPLFGELPEFFQNEQELQDIWSNPDTRKKLLEILQRSMDGKVLSKNEEFFLKSKQGDNDFTLLAEGIRKLARLWVLIQNGTLLNGSILSWEEPETHKNHSLMNTVSDI